MKKLTGISASSGIVIGKAFLYLEEGLPEIPRYRIPKNQVGDEWKRLLAAFEEASGEVRALHERAKQEMSKEQAYIFAAHLLMLGDPDFQDQIKARLEAKLENSEWVFWEVSRELTYKMSISTDPYLRERAADITDVSRRIMRSLLAIKRASLADLTEDVILVAHDLLPSEVLTMNRERVKGIVMDMGSRTSHTAILSQAFAIPSVLGLSQATREINNGDILVLNGITGEVVVNPEEKELPRYRRAMNRYRKAAAELDSIRDLPAETLDGRRVLLKANIEIPEEA